MKKEKKTKLRMISGIILIVVGLAICAYPIISQMLHEEQSESLTDIAINRYNEAVGQAPTQEPTQKATVLPTTEATVIPSQSAEPTLVAQNTATPTVPATATDAFADLIETDEDEIDESTAQSGKDLLGKVDVIGVIEIPAIDLVYAVVSGTTKQDLAVAIGHLYYSADIGAIGNCALAGHRGGTTGKYFVRINELQPGDEIIVKDIGTGLAYTYYMTESFIVQPTDVWVASKNVTTTQQMLTLVTCEDDGATRLIVRAVAE